MKDEGNPALSWYDERERGRLVIPLFQWVSGILSLPGYRQKETGKIKQKRRRIKRKRILNHPGIGGLILLRWKAKKERNKDNK